MKNSSELSRRALLIGSATLLSVPVLGQVRQGRPKELLGPRGRMMDSAPAIQQAVDRLTAQGGGVLVLRPGEYWIGTPIVLRRDVRFELGGATLSNGAAGKLTPCVISMRLRMVRRWTARRAGTAGRRFTSATV